MDVIEYQLRNYGYRPDIDSQVAISNDALENSFHPIKNYLTGLSWDGEDQIQGWGHSYLFYGF
jgi:predicted P-loop ATPase